MLQIRRNDIVTLPDGRAGRVAGMIDTDRVVVYKVQRSDDGAILYFEESLIRLLAQDWRNATRMYSREVLNFLLYAIDFYPGRRSLS